MLIDVTDVYIKHRDDNVAVNGVDGVLLRALEYFNGLRFLTLNRVGSIDEAIVSRCIALIRYSAPEREERLAVRTACDRENIPRRQRLAHNPASDRVRGRWQSDGRIRIPVSAVVLRSAS